MVSGATALKTPPAQPVHPAVLILLWILFTVAMHYLTVVVLLIIGILLLLTAYTIAAQRLRALLRRTSWIFLSLLFIYAYATPGAAVWPPLAQYSPTHEGIQAGLLQLGRLAFALAGLAVILSALTQQQLIGGLYVLGYPLRYLGISRARAAVRLALTLQYAESAIKGAATNWRTAIEQMMTQVEAKQHSIELQTTPLTLRDYLLVVLGGVLLLWAGSI